MRFFFDVLRLEWRLQVRALRFRVGVGLFLLLSCAPPVAMAVFLRPGSDFEIGAASYLAWSLDLARALSVVLAMVIAGFRADQSGQRQIWPVLSAAGVSNGGYLWRRFTAMAVILAALTAVPPLFAAGMVMALRIEPAEPMAYVGSWLVLLLPAALIQAATWLALVTIAGGELAALLLLYVGLALEKLVTLQVLRRFFASTLHLDQDWLGFERLQWGLRGFWVSRHSPEPWLLTRLLSSDGAFDPRLALEWLTRALPNATLAVVLLTLAAGFARRTRRDLRPLELRSGHALRNLMRFVHGARQRYTPDAALRAERWRLAAALVVVVATVLVHAERQGRFEVQAAERYATETQTDDQPVTPRAVVPVERRISGAVRADGALEVTTRMRLENRGSEPAEVVALRLNAYLEATVEAVAGADELQVERRWDRLFLRPSPALPPGGALELVLTARGRPRDVRFRVTSPWGRRQTFAWRYRTYLKEGGHRNQYHDLAASRTRPAVSRRRVDLDATDLTPLVRFTPWTLTPPPTMQGELGYEVPPETVRPNERVEVDLATPPGFLLADACGNATVDPNGAATGRLRGGCRMTMEEFLVRGAPLRVVAAEPVVLAALPGHEASAVDHLPALEEVLRLSDEAWPGLDGLEALVAIEWPAPFSFDERLDATMNWDEIEGDSTGAFHVAGSLLSIAEIRIRTREALETGDLVGRLLAARLLDRRPIASEDQTVFRSVLSAAMERRMGLGPATGATISGQPWQRPTAGHPLEAGHRMLAKKSSALVAELVARLGVADFYVAIDDFLAAGADAEPGRLEELFERLEVRSGENLASFWEQHFTDGDALPELRLENVEVERAGQGFRVRGEVRNEGSGEARCPVMIKADGQTRSTRVTVGPQDTATFEVMTDRRPITALLEPEKTCFRWVNEGSPQAERALLGEAAPGKAR